MHRSFRIVNPYPHGKQALKFIKENLTKMGLGDWKGEFSCPTSHQLQTRQKQMYLASPHYFNYYFTDQLEEEKFLFFSNNSLANERLSHSASKSHYTSNSQFTPMDFLFISTLPTFPFPLKKSIPLLCSLDFPVVFL